MCVNTLYCNLYKNIVEIFGGPSDFPNKISYYILAESIHLLNSSLPNAHMSKFAEDFSCQNFPLYIRHAVADLGG